MLIREINCFFLNVKFIFQSYCPNSLLPEIPIQKFMENKKSANNSSIQTHRLRINKAIQHIEQNLEADLSLNTLAKITHYSPFHFHRIFSTICGETPHEFVIRKRMEKIAWAMLKQKNIPIKDFAYKYGFDSDVSFSRSFKKYFGVSASSFRKLSTSIYNKIIRKNSKIGKVQTKVEAYFCNAEKVKQWMQTNGKVITRFLPAQSLVYIRNRGDWELADAAFQSLRTWANKKGLLSSQNGKWLLVVHDNPAVTELSKLSHSSCLKTNGLNETVEDFGILTIPAGRFVVGSFEVSESEIKLAWEGTSIWLMENGHTYRDGHFFETFNTDSIFQSNAKHKIDICIPIE